MDEPFVSARWFDELNYRTRELCAQSSDYHDMLLRRQFESADLVFGLLPAYRKKALESIVMKGNRLLHEIASSGRAHALRATIIPCRQREEAFGMNRMFGDNSM